MVSNMRIKKGDKVKIISGKDSGKVGAVLLTFPKNNKVIVEGVNIVKKHVKPGAVTKEGGIIKKEAPINVSNVMYYDSKLDRPIRIGYTIVDGKKYRINKITKDVIDK